MTTGPQVVLVNGLPGSGKSTVARGLAARFERGVHLEGDLLQHRFTVSGLVGPGDEPADEAEHQLALRWRNLTDLARNFHDAGFTVVVDSLAVPRLVHPFLASLAPRRVSYVHLAPDRSVGLSRDAARQEKTIGDRYDWVAAEHEAFRDLGVWIDSTHQSPQETIDAAHEAVTSGAAHRWRRTTGRVVPVDDTGRVLLIEGVSPGTEDSPYWCTIGGAIDPGETARQAAARELGEEAGIDVDAAALGEPYRTSTVEIQHLGLTLVQQQTVFALHLQDAPEPDLSRMHPAERSEVKRIAWVPAEQVGTTYAGGVAELGEVCREAVAAVRR